ncbi:MAG TPA: hypothetical protein VID48_01180 [Solirubrobacteraceae bacterium]|jgi:hypothetical protein
MTSVPITATGERERERAQALLEMGFDGAQSVLLAATGRDGAHIDIQALRRLLEAGCERETALRIVL